MLASTERREHIIGCDDQFRFGCRRLSENLLLLELRDCLRSAGFADGKCDLVASVQGVQHAVLYLELFGSSAGIGSDSAALRLFNGNGPTNPIDCGDRSRKRSEER